MRSTVQRLQGLTTADSVSRGTCEKASEKSTMSDPDYSTWLTKRQAAAEIGCSTKTVEKLAHDRAIQQARWDRPRGPALVVFHPDDVARVASERRQGPLPAFLVPGPATPRNGKGAIARTMPDAEAQHALAAALSAFAAALQGLAINSEKSEKASQSFSQTLFLTVRDAAAVSGLSPTCLRRFIANGTLPAIRDRSWKIRRADLEHLTAWGTAQ